MYNNVWGGKVTSRSHVTAVTTPSLFARYSLSTTPQLTLMTIAYGQRRSILRRSSRDANGPHPDATLVHSHWYRQLAQHLWWMSLTLVRLLCWMRVAVFKWQYDVQRMAAQIMQNKQPSRAYIHPSTPLFLWHQPTSTSFT